MPPRGPVPDKGHTFEDKETMSGVLCSPIVLWGFCRPFFNCTSSSFLSVCSHKAGKGPGVWRVEGFSAGLAGGADAKVICYPIVKCLKCPSKELGLHPVKSVPSGLLPLAAVWETTLEEVAERQVLRRSL